MNIIGILRHDRSVAARFAVPVFVEVSSSPAKIQYGTGILINFRGHHVVLTCQHVVEPNALGLVFFGAGFGHSYQEENIFRETGSNPSLDLAWYRMSPEYAPVYKSFYPASDAILSDIDSNEYVVVHGFPIGRPTIQQGARICGPRDIQFTSATYYSVTESVLLNWRLRYCQRSIRWRQDEMLEMKTFQRLPSSHQSPFRAQGFSGGPVFAGPERRLAGFVTDVDTSNDQVLFFNPIHLAFAELDRHL
jgi:hypothetical protein